MPNKHSKYIIPAIGFSIISGMRSMAGLAMATLLLRNKPSYQLKNSALGFLQKPAAVNTLAVLALGELVGDKLPTAPNRISAGGLGGRIVMGGLTGSMLFKANDNNLLNGLIVGSTIAAAATYGSFYLRRTMSKSLPEPKPGYLEDLLVLALGIALLSIPDKEARQNL